MTQIGSLLAFGGYPAPESSGRFLREDLLDVAINLDKQKSAATLLALAKVEANGMIHEWVYEGLVPTATSGSPEGETWASQAVPGRVRTSNVVQTFKRNFAVSLDQVNYARKGMAPGVADEYMHQVENMLVWNLQSQDARLVAVSSLAVSAANVTDSPLMGGFRNYMVPTTAGVGSIQGTGASTAVLSAISLDVRGPWSRTRFMQLHQAMFNTGANPDTLSVDPNTKNEITLDVLGEVAAASGQPANTSAIFGTPQVIRQIHIDNSGTEFSQDIQFMRTDYGRVAVLVDRFVPTAATSTSALIGGAAFLIEKSKSRIAYWRPLKHYPLPTDGDYMRGYVHCGATYEALNPNCIGILFNLT